MPLVRAATPHQAKNGLSPRKKKQIKRNKRLKRRQAKKAQRRPKKRFYQLVDGPGLRVRRPHHAWGTMIAVMRLQEVMAAYSVQFPEAPPVWITDISKRRGGRLPPHSSHRDGRDVDIQFILKRPTKYNRMASARSLNAKHTWFIVKSFIDTGDVNVILIDRKLQRPLYKQALKEGYTRKELAPIFEYPRKSAQTLIRHWDGHQDHMHVRFQHEQRRRPCS
jgi:murein endopeptidase